MGEDYVLGKRIAMVPQLVPVAKLMMEARTKVNTGMPPAKVVQFHTLLWIPFKRCIEPYACSAHSPGSMFPLRALEM